MVSPDGPQVEVSLGQGDPSAPVICMAGELDLASVETAKSGMEPYLAARPQRVTFDLEKLTFMDSSGIALLVQVVQRRRAGDVDQRGTDHPSCFRGQRAPGAFRSAMTSRRRFGPSKESISAARRFVTRIISDAPVEVRESVAVMVSELSTNALVHAASGFDVVVDRSGETVLVAVTDWGGGAPELRSPKSTEPHGRGLRIVEALSDEWGIVSTSGGVKKTIWFRLYLRSSETDEDATTRETQGGLSAPERQRTATANPRRGTNGNQSPATSGRRHRGSRPGIRAMSEAAGGTSPARNVTRKGPRSREDFARAAPALRPSEGPTRSRGGPERGDGRWSSRERSGRSGSGHRAQTRQREEHGPRLRSAARTGPAST